MDFLTYTHPLTLRKWLLSVEEIPGKQCSRIGTVSGILELYPIFTEIIYRLQWQIRRS